MTYFTSASSIRSLAFRLMAFTVRRDDAWTAAAMPFMFSGTAGHQTTASDASALLWREGGEIAIARSVAPPPEITRLVAAWIGDFDDEAAGVVEGEDVLAQRRTSCGTPRAGD